MTTTITRIKLEMRGLGAMEVPIDEKALVELLVKLERMTPERKRKFGRVFEVSMELGAFNDLCRHHIQELQQPVIFQSVLETLNLLRDLVRLDEEIPFERKTEIERIGDGLPPSLFERMRSYMELVGVSPDAIVIRCQN